MYMRSLPSLV